MEEPLRVEPEASPAGGVEAAEAGAAAEVVENVAPAGQPNVSAVPRTAQHAESWWETLRSLLAVLVLVFGIRTFIAEATVIPTGSMENTILIGDHVFLNKLLYGPEVPYTPWRLPALRSVHPGEIIAFRYPRNPSVMYVKRVIAMGGDVVKIVNKKVYVNGHPLAEPYARYESSNLLPLRDNFPPSLSEISTLPAYWGLDPGWAREMPAFIKSDGLHVPRGYVFAMGDNRDNSEDSRFWGFVPLPNVVGEPLFVYWSYDAPTPDWIADGLPDRLKFDASIIRNFLQRTRWSRTGKVF
jgi:signal peptidase I